MIIGDESDVVKALEIVVDAVSSAEAEAVEREEARKERAEARKVVQTKVQVQAGQVLHLLGTLHPKPDSNVLRARPQRRGGPGDRAADRG